MSRIELKLTNRAEVVSAEAQQATYQALMEFVRTEWIDGPCENNQACKLEKPFLRTEAKADDSPSKQVILDFSIPVYRLIPQQHPNLPPPFLRAPVTSRSPIIKITKFPPNPPRRSIIN